MLSAANSGVCLGNHPSAASESSGSRRNRPAVGLLVSILVRAKNVRETVTSGTLSPYVTLRTFHEARSVKGECLPVNSYQLSLLFLVARLGTSQHSVAIVAHPPFIRSPYGLKPFANPNPACCAGATFRVAGPFFVSAFLSPGTVPVTRHPAPVPAASDRPDSRLHADQAQSAPAGTRPVSTNLQRAITCLRAMATIITRRTLPFPSQHRSLNHLLSALSG